jgi:hypothetical protein
MTHPLSQHPGHLAGQRLHLVHEHIPLRQLPPAHAPTSSCPVPEELKAVQL